MKTKKIVLKLSSGLLVRDQVVQKDWLDGLGQLVGDMQKNHYQLWLVTSGARAISAHDITKGQKELVDLYGSSLAKVGLKVQEVLLAKEDFEHRTNYLEIRGQLDAIAKHGKIALINERPDKTVSNYQFSDNDEIAGLVASMVDARRVVLASTVEGVLKPDGLCLGEVPFGTKTWSQYVSDTTSEHGTGGMLLKCQAAEHSASRGVEAIICSGKNIENLRRAATGESVGTRFAPDRRISARKRWILDKKDFATGTVQVDDGLARVIDGGGSVSLLTVGITSVDGEFLENDIVAIKHGQDILGYGEASMAASSAGQAVTDKQSKLLIHYDRYARLSS